MKSKKKPFHFELNDQNEVIITASFSRHTKRDSTKKKDNVKSCTMVTFDREAIKHLAGIKVKYGF